MLLDVLQHRLGCEYLSDLRYIPYNLMAKQLLRSMDLSHYTLKEIIDTIEYLYKAG